MIFSFDLVLVLVDCFQVVQMFLVFSFFMEFFPQISTYVIFFFICKLYHLCFFSHCQNHRIGIKLK